MPHGAAKQVAAKCRAGVAPYPCDPYVEDPIRRASRFRGVTCRPAQPRRCRSTGATPMTPPAPAFRGNKAALPSKPCLACGRPMTWRRRWARSWDEVKYCSDACRRAKGARG